MDFEFSNIKNVISELINRIPEWIGCVPDMIRFLLKPIPLITEFVTIGGPIVVYLFKLRSWRRNEISKLAEITNSETLRLIKSDKYIPTMGQTLPPHDGEKIFISSDRFSLLDRLMNDFQSKDKDGNLNKKRYMIMGGSGMGKSTFLIALFYKYIHNYKFKRGAYPIFIKSLSNPDVIEQIRRIKDDKSNQSILLLDALDENLEASKDLSKFMSELEAVSHEFKFVIITCRTQFYKDFASEPEKWGIPISGASDNRIITYEKIYISPFNDDEVKAYLKFRYESSIEDFKKAELISKKCLDIVSRPMILSFIDDILELDIDEEIKTVEIYSSIIDKWFERERDIRNIDKSRLLAFSKQLAVFMYEKWLSNNVSEVTKDEYQSFINKNGYYDDPYSYNERSLINRSSKGAIKFSHRSFWEFFLAIDSFEHPWKSYYAERGLSMAKLLHNEIYELYRNDIKLDCINYYNCSFFHQGDFTDLALKMQLDKIQSMLEDKMKEPNKIYHDLIHVGGEILVLWEMLLKRLPKQYTVFSFSKKMLKKETKLYQNNTKKILRYVQDCFLSYTIDFLRGEFIPNLISLFNIMSELKIENGFKEIKSVKERLIFPASLDGSRDANYIDAFHVGLGFGDFDDLEKSIVYLSNRNPFSFLLIYCDKAQLNQVINAVKDTKSIRILLRVYYDNTTIDFLFNNTYSNERIMKIINGMYIAKNIDILHRVSLSDEIEELKANIKSRIGSQIEH